ncbi:MAG: right-handed parallel beta-helix repeat-containing protein [Lachnospiraceae bacterium]|nr:right-handed parallel beta-helix repeat-containing protein [Lachnospiraceae bacterium]
MSLLWVVPAGGSIHAYASDSENGGIEEITENDGNVGKVVENAKGGKAKKDSDSGKTKEEDSESSDGETTEEEDSESSGSGKTEAEDSDGKKTEEDNDSGKTEAEDADGKKTEEDTDSGKAKDKDKDKAEDKAEVEDEDDEPEEVVTRKKPALKKSAITLYAGWKGCEIAIKNLDEEDTVTYESTKEKVATVDEEGYITPIKKGSTKIKITITDPDGHKYNLKLSVNVKKPYSEVTDSNDVITTNGDFTFRLKRYGHEESVKWSLKGSQYASVEAISDTDCVVTGIAPGEAELTVTCGKFTETFKIDVYEGTGTAFRITEEKRPYKDYFTGRSEYNEYTKDYYVVRSYLERLSTLGGGMLIFAAGTYHFTNTLCIPSNTTILIEDGATLVKTDYTGDPWIEPTQSLFQTVSYSHTQTKFSEYNGEHDITIIGQGSATIDLNFVKSIALTAAHCQRLTVKGISFKNLNSLHFIELDASKDVEISGNVFSGCVPSPTQRKEAINIDTPDEETNGFKQGWTSYDCTPNLNVTISDNVFENLETAIGTHKYSEGMYHTNIVIKNNTFVDVTSYVVRMMNWKDCVVSDNYFMLRERADESKTVNAVILNGAVNPTVTGNLFDNFTTAIKAAHWKNSGSGKIYAETYNKLSKKNLNAMKKNKVVDCTNNYFEVYTVFGDNTDQNLKTYKFTKGT